MGTLATLSEFTSDRPIDFCKSLREGDLADVVEISDGGGLTPLTPFAETQRHGEEAAILSPCLCVSA
jgi:hypothetical protein